MYVCMCMCMYVCVYTCDYVCACVYSPSLSIPRPLNSRTPSTIPFPPPVCSCPKAKEEAQIQAHRSSTCPTPPTPSTRLPSFSCPSQTHLPSFSCPPQTHLPSSSCPTKAASGCYNSSSDTKTKADDDTSYSSSETRVVWDCVSCDKGVYAPLGRDRTCPSRRRAVQTPSL